MQMAVSLMLVDAMNPIRVVNGHGHSIVASVIVVVGLALSSFIAI